MSLRELLIRIRLIDPPKLPENEIQRDAYEAGYESSVSDKNPHSPGSINFRSWDQGKRERARYEQTLW